MPAMAPDQSIPDEITASELRKRILEGHEAKHQMINANLRLGVRVAKVYSARTSLHLLDLVEEGVFGPFKAVDKFDYKKGSKFSKYANWWIRQTIARSIANKGRLIRLPPG